MITTTEQYGTFSHSTARDMLRGKFWSGLKDDKVKSAIRHKIDQGDSFKDLLKRARSVEMENPSSSSKIGNKEKVSELQQTASVDKLDEILKQLRALDGRVQKIERKSVTNNSNNKKSNKSDFN